MSNKLLTGVAMKIMVAKGNSSLRHLQSASLAPFEENEALTIVAPQGSRGEEYALKNKIRFEPTERAATRRL